MNDIKCFNFQHAFLMINNCMGRKTSSSWALMFSQNKRVTYLSSCDQIVQKNNTISLNYCCVSRIFYPDRTARSSTENID